MKHKISLVAAIVAGSFLSISTADAGVQNDAFKADKQANAANNKMSEIAYTTGTNSAESQQAYIDANNAGAKRALAFAKLNGTPRINHTPPTQNVKGTAYVAPEKLALLTSKSGYANKHTGTPQYVVNTSTSKPVYYGETHRPNTSTTIVVSRNTTTAPITTTTTSTVSDNSQNKQLFILNTMADIAHYNAQQFNADNINIAENHRHSAENSAAIRANSQRLDSVEQHQSSQDSRIDENKKQASAGVSAAFAQANIPQVTENQTFAVGAGVGGYDDENAIAVGASFHATSNSVVKLTVSDDSQDNVGYGAGVSVGW
ncbi:YadA C-terminal domain-containing protein [Obesumbacterium proteus]|uniref:YadA C-terminal domain-containing protein n=1 Tax=Obesumbacterium proteus TaxID=82983 RepID=UPI001F16844B|nr:YadA C-terminal domain-containing protein [Obesumbacterium proteus]MCE9886426.1 YadA C-terminal domain-containing protein [Obesumbacterium proteus]MCE9916435.1 YadA C-terminal domain-containing protein [Obesumbacterium proteus]MCE9929243.1 YadA C-terminal domain-containing protein [Obesumbacterium proteus]MCG2876724.1 YadA C-terminal domain-containing protein [Obesumbacterium proteus]